MKRNKSNHKQRFAVLLIFCAMFVFVVAGCNQVTEKDTVDSVSEVESELVSEEVKENASEEVSEEAVSEEVPEEEVNEVEYVNFSNVDELLEHLEKYDRTTIVQYNFSEEGSPQAIIPNGGHYTITEGTIIKIIPNKEVNNIQANVGYIVIDSAMTGWSIYFYTTGTDLEVSFTVNYADGTSEDFIIYVTVE